MNIRWSAILLLRKDVNEIFKYLVPTVLVLLLLFSSSAEAHYNLTGFKCNDEEDFIYCYYNPGPNYGSAIPYEWRPYIGFADRAWSSNSSAVDFGSVADSSDANNYIYRANWISEIALTDVYYNSSGNVLFWAIMFNEDNNFHINGKKYDVKTVALHEFGHVLGIAHVGFSLLADTRAHMMYLYYTKAKPLHAHDISALKAIYGP
jgi:hypothetical protein